MSKGIQSLINFINSHPNKAKIVEISKNAKPFKVDRNNPNFDKPLSELNRDYSQTGNVKLITKICTK